MNLRSRRLLSIFLILLLLISCMEAFAADGFIPDYNTMGKTIDNSDNVDEILFSKSEKFTDVTDKTLYKKLLLLSALNIVETDENGNFNADATITRAEFAAWVLKAIKVTDVWSSKTGEKFYDVDASHKLYPQICTAVELGLMSGYSDKTLRPDNPIAFDEAIAMLLNGMGYAGFVDRSNALASYYALASRIGLLSGVTAAAQMTRGDGANLIMQALRSPVVNNIGSDSKIESDKSAANSMLARYHNTYEASGQMTTTAITSLDGGSVGKNEVIVDKVTYQMNDTSYNAFLGYAVELYYTQDQANGDKTILCMWKDSNVSEMVILAHDLEGYSDGIIEYIKNEKTQKARLDAAYTIIKNGKVQDTFDEDIFKLTNGKMVLVSNDGSNTYDLIYIDTYINVVLDSLELVGNKIRFNLKYGVHPFDIDMSDSKVVVDCVKSDGTKIPFGASANKSYNADGKVVSSVRLPSIAAGSVISIYADQYSQYKDYMVPGEDAKYYKMIVSGFLVSGVIKEMFSDGADFLKIDEQDYYVSPYNFLYAEDQPPKLRQSGTFLLDYNGEITAMKDYTTEEYQYGYLMTAKQSADLSQTVGLKLVLADDTKKVFSCSDSMKINGEKATNSDSVMRMLYASARYVNADSAYGYEQVVKFKLNKEGEISDLQILRSAGLTGISSGDPLTRAAANKAFSSKQVNGYMLYQTGDPTNNKYTKPEIFFRVPTVPGSDEDDYGIYRLWAPDDSSKTVDLYDVSKYLVPKVGVVKASSDPLIIGKTVMVDKVSRSLNSDGEAVDILKACNGLAMVSFEAKTDGVFKGLKKGDVIFVKGNKNIVESCTMVQSIDALPDISSEPAQRTYTIDGESDSGSHMTDYYQLYLRNDRHLICYRGAENDDGTRAYSKLLYWSKNIAEVSYGAILYDNSGSEPVVRVGVIYDLREAAVYGDADSSRILSVERYSDLKQLIIYNGVK